MKRFLQLLGLCLVLTGLGSCGEVRTWQYEEKTQHNQWMYDVMVDKYLWSDALAEYEPAWKSFFATPDAFLSTLTSKVGHSDAWSYVEIDTVRAAAPCKNLFFIKINFSLLIMLLFLFPSVCASDI